ncbi:MAG: OmpA family protein [Bacteroidales bacterium]|nr:OmpA family protein [Bacteroidales bacterium]
MKIKYFIVIALSASFLSSCVTPRKVEDERNRRIACEEENKNFAKDNKELSETNNELSQKNNELTRTNDQLSRDTTVMGASYRRLVVQYDKVNDLNDELLAKMKEKNAMTDAEARRLLTELQILQEDLQKREDSLKLAQLKLSEEQNKLEKISKDLDNKQAMLDEKNARVLELERMIAAKDSALTAFREKLSHALLGFEGDGLTIEQRDGKVYVSLEEKLLFKSGRWEVDPKGQSALNKLAQVLVDNADINVMIEGHTDNVPYKGSNGIDDNWDLSVKRSTAIVKILLNNKNLLPERVIAAGRSEFVPISANDSSEGRAKNRRTEIILTPKWDEVFKVLEK